MGLKARAYTAHCGHAVRSEWTLALAVGRVYLEALEAREDVTGARRRLVTMSLYVGRSRMGVSGVSVEDADTVFCV